MKKINNQPRYSDIVGVDIRDNVVHLLQFKTGRDDHKVVRSIGRAPLPVGAVVRGVIENAQIVGEAIRQACQQAKPHSIPKNAPAAISLPESKTFLRIISLPQMEAAAVGDAVRWEMESYIPIPVDEVVYDWRILPKVLTGGKNDDKQMSVLVIAVANTVVEQYTEALNISELSLVSVEVEALAQVEALAPMLKQDVCVMMVFVGNHSTRIAVVYQGIPLLTASVMAGRATIVSDIERGLKMSNDEAERIVNTDGIGSYIDHDPLFVAATPGLEAVVAEIVRNANFCHASLQQCPHVDTMAVFGVGATIKGLRAYLVKQSQMKVLRVNPWQSANIDPKKLPPLSRDESMDIITLIGLSLNTVSYEDIY